MLNKRGVYFFVIDAFIGGAIVLISLFVILRSYSVGVAKDQPLVILEDFITYVDNTEVRDFQGNLTQNLISNGTINDFTRTISQQIGYFQFTNNVTLATALVEEIVNASLPDHMSIMYFYANVLVYQRQLFPRVKADLVLSSKKISLVAINESFIYGPNLVEVILWSS